MAVQHLTEEEKERCRYHMGYPETTFGNEQAAAGIVFGIGKPMQTTFLLENAIQQLLTNPYAMDRVRSILDQLDKIEAAMKCAVGNMNVAKLGEIELRGAEAGKTHTDMLEREYSRWQQRLADVLGVPVYPFSTRSTGRSRNLKVSG